MHKTINYVIETIFFDCGTREELITELKTKEYKDTAVECKTCKKKFNNRSSMYRHAKICKDKEETEIEKLRSEVKELKKLIESQPSTSNTINSNNTYNIQINSLGKEDISYMATHKGYDNFMLCCIKDKIEGVCNFLVKKHFNDNMPQNKNIKKTNKKDSFIECYKDNKWKTRFVDNVLDEVFMSMESDFVTFLDKQKGTLKKNMLDNFMKQVGCPLEWDLDHGDYEFSEEISDSDKEILKKKIYMMACEYIYKSSKI